MNEKKERNSFWFSVIVSFLIIVALCSVMRIKASAADDFRIIGSGSFEYQGETFTYYRGNYVEISNDYYYHFSDDVYFLPAQYGDTTFQVLACVSKDSFSYSGNTSGNSFLRSEGVYCASWAGSVDVTYPAPYSYIGNTSADDIVKAFCEHVASDDFEEIKELPDLSNLTYYHCKLLDFTANNSIRASWSGLTKGTLELEDTYVVVEFVYKPIDGNTLVTPVVTVTYDEIFDISAGGFFVSWLDLQNYDSNYYLSCMKVTPVGTDSASGITYKGQTSSILYDTTGSVIVSSLNDEAFGSIHGGGGAENGTEILSDFYLDGVRIVKSPLVEIDTIKWNRCTNNVEYLTVPDSDTLVLCSVVLYDSDLNIVIEEYASTTIGEGQIKVNWGDLEQKYSESDYMWNYEVRLTPGYRIDNKLCIGQQTVINIANSTILNEGIDSDDNFVMDDVTDDYADWSDNSILDNASNFMSDSEGFAKYVSTFFGFVYSLVGLMGDIPLIIGTVFSFLPSFYSDMLGMVFIIIVICRVLGR